MPKKPTRKRVVGTDGKLTVHGKAANGEGSIYYESANERWVAAWRDATGKLRRVSGPTREAVTTKRELRQELQRAGAATAPDTVESLANHYLTHVAITRLRDSSYEKAKDRVANIIKDIGTVRVTELTAATVEQWQAAMLASGKAPKTVSLHRSTFCQVVEQAVISNQVTRNVVRSVKPPKVPRAQKRALEVDDVSRLISEAERDPMAAAVAMLYLMGMRVSEVLGLAWSDIDLDTRSLTIRRGLVYVEGKGARLGPTKTDGALGVHEVLPETVVRLLNTRRLLQGQERELVGDEWRGVHNYAGETLTLVFTNAENGGPIPRQRITKTIKAAALRAGLDPQDIATHTGRRSVITNLYKAGQTLDDIARHVGQVNTATTAGYVRDLGKRPQEFASRAALLLDPTSNQPKETR